MRESLHLRAPRRDRLLPHVTAWNNALLDPAYHHRLPLDADLAKVRLGLHELLRRLQLDGVRDDQHHNDHDHHHDDRHHGNEHHDHHDFLVPADHGLLLRPVL